MNNMVMLGALGWNLELEIGKLRFIIIYFLSGIGGNILSLIAAISAGESAVSAGASGAVFGLMGALLYVVIANRKIRTAFGKRNDFYGCSESLFWVDEQRS